MNLRKYTFVAMLALFLLSGCDSSSVDEEKTTNVDTSTPDNTSPNTTSIDTSTWPKEGTTKSLSIPTPSLEGGMLESFAKKSIKVYLPPSYYETTKTYPVMYFLSGFGADANALYEHGLGVFKRANKWSVDNTDEEMIIVAIDGVNTLGGSFYANSEITGNWQDYVAFDVVDFLDTHYRTIPDAEHRGLAGHSMGGSGALTIGMSHPDIFAHIYSMSPGLFSPNGFEEHKMTQNPIKAWLISLVAEVKNQSAEEALTTYKRHISNSRSDSNRMFALAQNSAFSGQPTTTAPYFSYIYESADVVNSNEWKSVEAGFGDVENRVITNANNFNSLKNIVLDVGVNDEYTWIIDGTRHFSDVLTAQNISHELREHEGNHVNHMAQRFSSQLLPFFASAFPND